MRITPTSDIQYGFKVLYPEMPSPELMAHFKYLKVVKPWWKVLLRAWGIPVQYEVVSA
jgi:hypothetical protein